MKTEEVGMREFSVFYKPRWTEVVLSVVRMYEDFKKREGASGEGCSQRGVCL